MQQLLGPQVRDDGVQIAVAVDVTKIRLRAVGDRRRQVRGADVGEDARAVVEQQPVRPRRRRVGALGDEEVQVAVVVDIDEIDVGRGGAGQRRVRREPPGFLDEEEILTVTMLTLLPLRSGRGRTHERPGHHEHPSDRTVHSPLASLVTSSSLLSLSCDVTGRRL